MLILTRRPGESIRVGKEIEISILEVRGNQVRLGVTAPSEVLVLRSELLEKQPAEPTLRDAPYWLPRDRGMRLQTVDDSDDD